MRKIVTFYYDYFSPYSYLALTQLPRLLDRCGARVEYAPIHVLTLMGVVGNRPTTIECKAKGVYARADLQRWARMYGVPFAANPNMRGIDGRRLLDGAAAAAARLAKSKPITAPSLARCGPNRRPRQTKSSSRRS
jgi:2-hydroxychromene-2-carboxylate isomerase